METEQLSPQEPIGGKLKGTLLSLDCEIKVKFCFIKTLSIAEPERYVKEGSVNCKSLHRIPVRELGGGSFTGEFDRQQNLGSFFLDPEDVKSV